MAIVENADLLTMFGGSLSTANQNLLTLLHPGIEALVKQHVGFDIVSGTYTERLPLGGLLSERDALIEGWETRGDRAVAYGKATAGSRLLFLKHRPVLTITAIYENLSAYDAGTVGGDWPASTLLASTAYQLDLEAEGSAMSWSGIVYSLAGGWSTSPRTIRVDYTAGLTAAQLATDYPQFRAAVMDAVMQRFNQAKAQQGYATGGLSAGAVIAEHLADWGVTYSAEQAAQLYGLLIDLPESTKRILEPYVSMRKYLG